MLHLWELERSSFILLEMELKGQLLTLELLLPRKKILTNRARSIGYCILKKFHQYLYGWKFTLITDHKPLVTIFGLTASLSIMAASRMQRWALILSGYYFTIQYKPTAQHGNAEALSRLPQVTTPDALCLDQEVHAIQRVVEKLPIQATDIQQATRRNPVMSQVVR